MERKHKCRYCDKMIYTEGGLCSHCKEKLMLVRKLLRMVKTAAGKEANGSGRI
jgi:hypothetical protein